MVAARRRPRRTVGLRTLSGSILVAQAKQVEVRSAQVRYQARPGDYSALRLAPAGPPCGLSPPRRRPAGCARPSLARRSGPPADAAPPLRIGRVPQLRFAGLILASVAQSRIVRAAGGDLIPRRAPAGGRTGGVVEVGVAARRSGE